MSGSELRYVRVLAVEDVCVLAAVLRVRKCLDGKAEAYSEKVGDPW